MRVVLTPSGWADYGTWAGERKVVLRIDRMIDGVRRNPDAGIGEPEGISGDPSGFWSPRIDDDHRLVCAVTGDDLVVVQARYHY